MPLSLEEARRLVTEYAAHYSTVPLHSAIGYVAPKDQLEIREREMFDGRDRNQHEAREARRARRQAVRQRRQTAGSVTG